MAETTLPEHFIMVRFKPRVWDAVCLSAGMVVFSLCAHRDELIVPRVAGLILAGLAIVHALARSNHPLELLGLKRPPARWIYLSAMCIAVGVGLGIFYRSRQGNPLLPSVLTYMCILSVAIGICEELVYRGFVQGCLAHKGLWIACIAAAAAHTAYKCCLFMFPAGSPRADLFWLGGCTFVVGVAFGLMRERFGGVLFPVLAHAAFDAIVYGGSQSIPWWV